MFKFNFGGDIDTKQSNENRQSEIYQFTRILIGTHGACLWNSGNVLEKGELLLKIKLMCKKLC